VGGSGKERAGVDGGSVMGKIGLFSYVERFGQGMTGGKLLGWRADDG